jgi:purine operon repressor
LYSHPNALFSLSYFADLFEVAKSTVSEDIANIKQIMQEFEQGEIETFAGITGGVKYIPKKSKKQMRKILEELAEKLSVPGRIVPGGYLYMTDLIFNPQVTGQIGEIFATKFYKYSPDFVITVETKGIPIAFATAHALNIPLVTIRRDSRVTEGSAVSINYISGTSGKIQTMSLARRALPVGSKVIIIDDFMKAGGTMRGMLDLLAEFSADVVGMGVLAETEYPRDKLVEDYFSLLIIERVDNHEKEIRIRPSDWVLEGGE